MTCLWIGNGQGCDQSALEGRSYCQEHIWQVYQKGTALGRRKRDHQRALNLWELEGELNAAITELEAEGYL